MSKILSDTTKRIIIVEGFEEAERIKDLYRGNCMIEVKELSANIYEVEITYSVGDYYKK